MKKLKFNDIKDYDPINNLESDKAQRIFSSILNGGWKEQFGPILVYEDRLLTGTHRLQALKTLYEVQPQHAVFQQVIAWDMTEEIHQHIDEEPEDDFLEKSYVIDDFSCGLGEYLQGTQVEKFKEYIKEW